MAARYISRFTFALLIAAATLCLIFTATCFADALSVFPPAETRVRTGSEATLPVYIKDAQDLGALQFELIYDEEILEVVNVTPGSGMPPVLLDFNVVRPGLLRVALAGSEPIDGDTQIKVRIRGLATGSGAFELQEVKAWELTTGYDLLLEVQPGQVTVAKGLPLALLVAAGVVILVLLLILLLKLVRRKKQVGGQAPQKAGGWASPLPQGPAPSTGTPSDSGPGGRPTPGSTQPRMWYVARDGQQYGPYDGRSLGEMIKNGNVQPGDLVWNDSLTEWVRADSVKETF